VYAKTQNFAWMKTMGIGRELRCRGMTWAGRVKRGRPVDVSAMPPPRPSPRFNDEFAAFFPPGLPLHGERLGALIITRAGL
jgi:hypothetical protein